MITIRKDPSTPKITELVDHEQFCGVVADDAQAFHHAASCRLAGLRAVSQH